MKHLTLLILLFVCSLSQTVRAQTADSWVSVPLEGERLTVWMPKSYEVKSREFSFELRAVFSRSGEVTEIRVVNGLPHGLSGRAVDAARRIRFIPAQKDGNAVSMFIQLEYNFNLY